MAEVNMQLITESKAVTQEVTDLKMGAELGAEEARQETQNTELEASQLRAKLEEAKQERAKQEKIKAEAKTSAQGGIR